MEAGAWNSDWKVELGLELGAWSLECGLILGIRFWIEAWNLDWVLKLGGLKHLNTLKPCCATWRPAEADYTIDNCNAKVIELQTQL